MIDAIVFDFDGLILETETPVWEACREIYQQYGHDLPLADWVAVLGQPAHKSDLIGRLERLAGVTIDREACRAQRSARIRQRLAGAPAMPGVEAYLAEAKRRRLARAVCSGSDRAWVSGHLRDLGLLEAFDLLVTAEDTDAHKPDPAPYREACRRLGTAPARTIALEDSPNGICSARAAGLWTVAVPTALTRGEAFAEAHLQVESLADVPLPMLLERIAAAAEA